MTCTQNEYKYKWTTTTVGVAFCHFAAWNATVTNSWSEYHLNLWIETVRQCGANVLIRWCDWLAFDFCFASLWQRILWVSIFGMHMDISGSRDTGFSLLGPGLSGLAATPWPSIENSIIFFQPFTSFISIFLFMATLRLRHTEFARYIRYIATKLYIFHLIDKTDYKN